MKYVILGIQHKVGTFVTDDKRSIDYDNVNLYCAKRPDVDGVLGAVTEVVKVKSALFTQFCKENQIAISADLLGSIVNVSYGKYSRIEEVSLVKLAANRTDDDGFSDFPM